MDAATTEASARRSPSADEAARLVRVVEATLRELHAAAAALPAVTLQSLLDRDLGFDSLARMELLLRVEREFGLELPEDALQRAETVGDLLVELQHGTARAGAPRPREVASPLPNIAPAAAGSPEQAATLVDVLQWHVRAHGDQTQVVFVEGEAEQPISYRQLAERAEAVAAGLQRLGVAPRQSVAIMLPTSPEYFASYFGILMAGAVPVPIYPPARASQLEDHVIRHSGILANAQAVVLISFAEAMVVARLLQARVPGLHRVVTARQLSLAGATFAPVPLHGDDIAFIQYTSGSTGNPKGVALTHANLLANIRAMVLAVQATSRDVFVSWLPLYHDMGLIGAWLSPLYAGFPSVVMSPLAFLAKPQRWLDAIHRWRGTLSAAPNFAYELCLKRIGADDMKGLDLSCWRLAFNGAEAVSPSTVQRFSAHFAACGLRPETMAPVYGLAEASVGLLFPPLGRVAPIDVIQREPFTRERRALPAPAGDATALRFVACGRVLPGHAIRIVDDAGHEVGERIEGHLEFQGPSATRGYFRNPEQTAKLLRNGWLDTGDRAYVAAGDVYITGRVKDIVIRGGRNLYPQEIEEAVSAVDGIRKGCVAVFGSPDPATGTERLVVLAEAQPSAMHAAARLRDAVARAVVAAIGEPPDQIVLAPPHTVLKTSSGKVRRSACRALVEAGEVGRATASPARQMLRLASGAVGPRLRQARGAVLSSAFGLRASALFWLLAPATWALTLLMPHPAAAWRLGHAAARALFRLAGTRFTVEGIERLPEGPCVLVSNHASYLDGVILVAALPRPFAFVAKEELRRQPIAGPYLRALGAMFVERFDVKRSVEGASQMAEQVRGGASLAVFPEGTFVAQPGLLPFHLGAYLAAATAAVPIVPVAIRGSRALLADGRWWPRPARLTVRVLPPIAPSADAPDLFAAAVRMRDASRQAIGAMVEAE
jgi:acyl carrier protein